VHSANPVGHLVLYLFGHRDRERQARADDICTALQLTNFWQDFGHDWIIGRLYVPRDVTAACRAREMDLQGPFLNDAWMAAMRQCFDQTRAQFDAGRAVCDGVAGRLRVELRLTWLGGMRILQQVERTGPALLSHRPTLGKGDIPLLLWRAVRWPS
jgi:phytoene/squalene synthetase